MEALLIKGENLKPIVETAKAFGYKCKLTHIKDEVIEKHEPKKGTCELCPFFISMKDENGHILWGRCTKHNMAAINESHEMCAIGKALSKDVEIRRG